MALTSVLSSRIVNDLRFSYFSSEAPIRRATAADCPGCFGLGAERITITDVGLTFGGASTSSGFADRFQLTESLVWQKGNHRLQFGFDWEHATPRAPAEPGPGRHHALGSRASSRPGDSFASLVHHAGRLSAASIAKLLDQRRSDLTPVEWLSRQRVLDLYRLYASDTWRAGPRLTMNSGLGWSYEPNALNHDLTKPALLIPILGPQGLKGLRFKPGTSLRRWALRG